MSKPSEEIAWAAGLFEGEGCITLNHGNPVLRLASTDEDSTRRFHEIVALGAVYGPYDQGPPRRPFWVWVASSVDARIAVQQLSPWLGQRRRARVAEVFGRSFVR